MARPTVHASITSETVTEGIEQDIGFCIRCGAETDGVEPDAHDRRCDECGELAVYGAEELVIAGLYHEV